MYGAKALGGAARERGIGNSDTSFRAIQYSKNAFSLLYFNNQVLFDVFAPLRKCSTWPLAMERTETSPTCREKARSIPAPPLKEMPNNRFRSTYVVTARANFIKLHKD